MDRQFRRLMKDVEPRLGGRPEGGEHRCVIGDCAPQHLAYGALAVGLSPGAEAVIDETSPVEGGAVIRGLPFAFAAWGLTSRTQPPRHRSDEELQDCRATGQGARGRLARFRPLPKIANSSPRHVA